MRVVPGKASASPYFEPWLGETYRRERIAHLAGEANCRDGLWHVMGESHYGDDPHPTATKRVMCELALTERGYPFFDTILSIVSGKAPDRLDRTGDWSRLAFSNFVQGLLPERGVRPGKREWDAASNAFFGQLAITCPKQLLVVGKTAWENLPSEGFVPLALQPSIGAPNVSEAGAYLYEVDGRPMVTLATWIYHPSSRGRLDVELAKERVRELTRCGCNVRSGFRRDPDGWLYE